MATYKRSANVYELWELGATPISGDSAFKLLPKSQITDSWLSARNLKFVNVSGLSYGNSRIVAMADFSLKTNNSTNVYGQPQSGGGGGQGQVAGTDDGSTQDVDGNANSPGGSNKWQHDSNDNTNYYWRYK